MRNFAISRENFNRLLLLFYHIQNVVVRCTTLLYSIITFQHFNVVMLQQSGTAPMSNTICCRPFCGLKYGLSMLIDIQSFDF